MPYQSGSAQAVFLSARTRATNKLLTSLAALLALILTPHAWATTYTLSGATYSSVTSLYAGATGVTGSFTTASPLPPNLANAPIAGGTGGLGLVTSWSFNDGVFSGKHYRLLHRPDYAQQWCRGRSTYRVALSRVLGTRYCCGFDSNLS